MRVLLTNNHLQHVGGTEKWVYSMARNMKERGIDVEVFTFMKGMTSQKLEEAGIRVVSSPGSEYDLSLINHNTCLAVCKKVRGPKVFTSHGPLHPLEFPMPGADFYVGVSEEIRATWIVRGFHLSVIRNGIDLEEFYPTANRNEKKHILSMCKNPVAGAIVAAAAEAQGVTFEGVHYLARPVWDMAQMIQRADVVFACGRSAYEALACGKTVVVYDDRTGRGPSADGILTKGNVDLIAQCNCSTRYNDLQWDQHDVERAISEAGTSPWARPWAEKNTDIVKTVDAYLSLIGE
jgi:hypothetical protein